MFEYKQFYVCALVVVVIKCLYEMHGATINTATCFGYYLWSSSGGSSLY